MEILRVLDWIYRFLLYVLIINYFLGNIFNT